MQLSIKFRFKYILWNIVLLQVAADYFPRVLCKMEKFQTGLSHTHQNVHYTECYEQKDPLSAAYVPSHGRLIWSLFESRSEPKYLSGGYGFNNLK